MKSGHAGGLAQKGTSHMTMSVSRLPISSNFTPVWWFAPVQGTLVEARHQDCVAAISTPVVKQKDITAVKLQ